MSHACPIFCSSDDDPAVSLEWPEDMECQAMTMNSHELDISDILEESNEFTVPTYKPDSIEDDLSVFEEFSESESLAEFDQDQEHVIFPIALEKADEVCVKLNDLISRGVISKDRIFYKYLNDICNIFCDIRASYDPEVVEFFNTIKYLGGERTVNFVRGPMWHGSGKGGIKGAEDAQMNLGGPSRTTRQHKSPGYTTKSGVNKPWLLTMLKLETDPTTLALPFVDTDSVTIYGVSMQNDGTALKAGIEFDEQQHLNIGLRNRVDIKYVRGNQHPDADVLKSSVITEANITYLTTIDNTVSFPVSVTYLSKCGKTGAAMKSQFLSEVDVLQMCRACIERAPSVDHIIESAESVSCCATCDQCIGLKGVCEDCKELNQPSYKPALRACKYCLSIGQKCIKNAVLVLSTDCEAGNKNALQSIIDDRENDDGHSKYTLSCIPDAVHVGKSLKAGFANWMLLLGQERACLAILHTLRDKHPHLRRILSKSAVMNKDRMDVDCILHLTKDSVLETLNSVGRVVHSIVPDEFKISSTNKVGMYPHPISVICGTYGKVLVLDYQPMKKTTRVLEVRLHIPADVQVLHEYKDARSIAFVNGIIYVCLHANSICMYPLKIKPAVNKMTKGQLKDALGSKTMPGTVAQLRQSLKSKLEKQEAECKKNGVDLCKVQLPADIMPSCIASASDGTLVLSSDNKRAIYKCDLHKDGIIMKGLVQPLTEYPSTCDTILSMSVKGCSLLVSYSGDPGGIFRLGLETLEKEFVVTNGTDVCGVVSCVAATQNDEFVFSDVVDHSIKMHNGDGIQRIAGTGQEGNDSGPAESASFSQPMGLCCEYESIFITDAQCGCVKILTTVKNSVEFLKQLGLLYAAFSVHLKHQKVPILVVSDALKNIKSVSTYLKECVRNVQDVTGISKAPNGPEGTVASKTIGSVQMIETELENLSTVLEQHSAEHQLDLQSCLTVQVENLHATGHFKEQFPTCLQHARNLSDTVHESIKRAISWSAYYYTHPDSYYPVPTSKMPLCDVPKVSKLGPKTELSQTEQKLMRNWATDFGKCVRQRTVRQETTKFKAGTLPLNMYQAKPKPSKKLFFEMEEHPANVVSERHVPESDNVDDETAHNNEIDQISEYDSDSSDDERDTEPVSVHSALASSSSNSLDFLRAVTTRSGRSVKVSFKYQ
ncbi:MAG: hypothetical protein ABW185_10700 [Sedimenticola sp.]